VAGAGANPFCPHAHSILIFTSPFPVAKVLIDAFTFLPTGTAWLGRLSWNIGAAGSSFRFLCHSHIHVNTGRLIFTVYKTHGITYIAYIIISST
jgi:hypothetical protein